MENIAGAARLLVLALETISGITTLFSGSLRMTPTPVAADCFRAWLPRRVSPCLVEADR